MPGFLQLALDLWGEPASSSVAPEAGQAPLPAVWQHPRANRRIRLHDVEVAYLFRRGRRRTIGLSVSLDGLTVSAPRWTPVAEVEALLRDKADWVVDKLRQACERSQALAQARIDWADGACFDYLGQSVRVRLDPTHASATLEPAGADGVAMLRLGLPRQADAERIRDAAQAWLMRQAQRYFSERLEHFGAVLGVRHKRLRLSSAGTRWGSASADGSIRLHWRLIHLSPALIDYVVVHELSHLRHMDHSPRFWGVVASVLPDYAERRQALRQVAMPLGA
jgi:predicted metal-dependent hydrolase